MRDSVECEYTNNEQRQPPRPTTAEDTPMFTEPIANTQNIVTEQIHEPVGNRNQQQTPTTTTNYDSSSPNLSNTEHLVYDQTVFHTRFFIYFLSFLARATNMENLCQKRSLNRDGEKAHALWPSEQTEGRTGQVIIVTHSMSQLC